MISILFNFCTLPKNWQQKTFSAGQTLPTAVLQLQKVFRFSVFLSGVTLPETNIAPKKVAKFSPKKGKVFIFQPLEFSETLLAVSFRESFMEKVVAKVSQLVSPISSRCDHWNLRLKKPVSESFTSYLLKVLPFHSVLLHPPRNGALLSQAMATISRLVFF